MVSEVDKCYLCDLLGDFEEFKDIKKQFDAQHECWKQNASKQEKNSKGALNNSHGGENIDTTIRNDQIQESVPNHNVVEPKKQTKVSKEKIRKTQENFFK